MYAQLQEFAVQTGVLKKTARR